MTTTTDNPAPSDACRRMMEAAFEARLDAIEIIIEEQRADLAAMGADVNEIASCLAGALDVDYFQPEAMIALAQWAAQVPPKAAEAAVVADVAIAACQRGLRVVLAGRAAGATH
jgi:hypothetical protein